jgi:hypothetical protein
VCSTGDTAHIDTIFKFLPHTRQHGCIDIFYCCNDPNGRNVNYDEKQLTGGRGAGKLICSFYLYRFCKYLSYGFPIINFCNPGGYYETPVLFKKKNFSSVKVPRQ